MSEQVNRKSIPAYTMLQPSVPYTYPITLPSPKISTFGIAMLSMLTMAILDNSL